MPNVTISVPPHTSMSMEIDVSDYLDEIEIEIDENLIGEAIGSGDLDTNMLLSHFDTGDLLAFLRTENVKIPDDLLIELIRERHDLLQIALVGAEIELQEKAAELYRAIMAAPTDEMRSVVNLLVRHLLMSNSTRLAITDAFGAHYAKAPLSDWNKQ